MPHLAGCKRPIHEVLGSGKVADVLLWRNKVVSGAHFLGLIAIWFLLEVAEYNLVMILCNLTITAMLVVFIWSNGARAFNCIPPPKIPIIQVEESTLYKDLSKNLHFILLKLIKNAYGKNIIHFCSTIIAIKLLAIIGNSTSPSNLLFTVLVCMGTLPCLYEKNEEAVDGLVDMMNKKVFGTYEMLNKCIMSKIPKWPKKSD